MSGANLLLAINEVQRKLGWERSRIIAAMIDAIRAAVVRKYGQLPNLEVTFNKELQESEAFVFKEVVANQSCLTDLARQITLASALRHDSEIEVGDELGLRINTDSLDLIASHPYKLEKLCRRYGNPAKPKQLGNKKPISEPSAVLKHTRPPITEDAPLLSPDSQPSEASPTAITLSPPVQPDSRQSSAMDVLVGGSRAIRALQEQIAKAAPTNATVLITGENGTGKEVVAQLLHRMSRRNQKPMVEVNCAAIPEELIESELFGNEKGAYTGATVRREGKFQAAHGGTLFLDEIGDLSLKAQAKMLRVIQEGRFERVGGNAPINVDVRIVAATNKDLAAEIASGAFRQDLYYRLNVIAIHVPPLRERLEDVPILADHFVRELSEQEGYPPVALSHNSGPLKPGSHAWPGNVRELRNWCARLMIMGGSEEPVQAEKEQGQQPEPARLPHNVVSIERAILRNRAKPKGKVEAQSEQK